MTNKAAKKKATKKKITSDNNSPALTSVSTQAPSSAEASPSDDYESMPPLEPLDFEETEIKYGEKTGNTQAKNIYDSAYKGDPPDSAPRCSRANPCSFYCKHILESEREAAAYLRRQLPNKVMAWRVGALTILEDVSSSTPDEMVDLTAIACQMKVLEASMSSGALTKDALSAI
ncbi:hypothetical protein BGX28_009992 [Mortierella sp. GBA30]|nr:hypothetical protein BGX28_009992 [Mortierella sp. GBA30]